MMRIYSDHLYIKLTIAMLVRVLVSLPLKDELI